MPVVNETGAAVRFTTSTVLRTGATNLLGLFVSNASSTPTLEILNAATSGSGTVVGQFTPIAGTFYPFPAACPSGLTIIAGGSVSGCAFFQAD